MCRSIRYGLRAQLFIALLVVADIVDIDGFFPSILDTGKNTARKDMYLLHHEEIESLAKNIPGVKRIRFFMTFGQSYLTHMKCKTRGG